jgi:hypothetical protein
VPGERFVIVLLMPEPVIAPGLIVHVLVEGKLFRRTLPVATLQVGCVIVDTEGADIGALITTFVEGPDAHPAAFVTEKL